MRFLTFYILYLIYINQKKDIDLQNRNVINIIKDITFSEKNKYDYTVAENDFKSYIVNFIKILEDNFDYETLSHLYNNISSLDIKVSLLSNKNILNKIIAPNVLATYSPGKNKIVFNGKSNVNNSIYHELFHMATSFKIKEVIFVGFSQQFMKGNNIEGYGVGFNEGYTDLLANRYFNKIISYDIEAEIAEQIENIVGRKVMEKLYLKADLKSLISELSKYSSLEEINDFINNVDMICLNKYINKNKVLMNLTANKILGFMYNIFMNRYKEDIERDKIYDKTLTKKLIEAQLKYLAILFKKYGINCWNLNEIETINKEKIKKLNNVKLVSFY